MNDSLKTLGDRLRMLRTRHGLTQEEFAQIAGIGHKFYQLIETANKKQIWLSTVEKLTAAYGIEIWELLAPETPENTKVSKKVASSRVHRR